jgi:hypothetical protein
MGNSGLQSKMNLREAGSSLECCIADPGDPWLLVLSHTSRCQKAEAVRGCY